MLSFLRRGTARGLRRSGRLLNRLADRIHVPNWQPGPGERAMVARNAELRDRYAGRPAFVIGNGGSLARHNLGLLADEVTFVANGFWRHPLMAAVEESGEPDWQPTFYSIVDPLYFDGSPPMLECFERIRRRAPLASFLVPARFLGEIRHRDLLPPASLRPCFFKGTLGPNAPCNYDLSRPVPHVQSVSLIGILAALHCGCNPIYLLGMDHDWVSRPVIRCDHFYQEVSVPNHPTFEAIEKGGAQTYLENLEGMAGLYRSYHRIAEVAAVAGVRILNATRGGFLDVFERVDYEQIVTRPAPRESEYAGLPAAAVV